MLKVCVLGSGYVGLVAAACFAKLGHQVVGVDVDKKRIENLQKNIIPIYEVGLEELVSAGQASGLLSFTTDSNAALKVADIIIVAVGTPSNDKGEIDKTYLYSATDNIAASAKDGSVVVIKSTVIPNTCAELADRLKAKDISVVSNPEFLREGRAVEDFMNPDRLLIGISRPDDEIIMRKLYGSLAEKHEFIVTSLASAELAKYACNAILAVRLSFVNEIADLCAANGADFSEVQKVMAGDLRIGKDYLQAGPGYGGSCLPKDTRALSSLADFLKTDVPTLQGAMRSNEMRKSKLIDRVLQRLDVSGKKIAMLGLAFKADSDDIRESPALPLAEDLLKAGAELILHDPKAMENVRAIFSAATYATTCQEALQNADAVIIMTEWSEYKKLNPADFKTMQGNIIIDFRGLYNKAGMKSAGLHYYPYDVGE